MEKFNIELSGEELYMVISSLNLNSRESWSSGKPEGKEESIKLDHLQDQIGDQMDEQLGMV